MVVSNEEFNNGTNCPVNLRATNPDFHPFLCGCPASCDEFARINLDGTQPTSASRLKTGMIAKMRNIDIIL
jgi:hypothetical protein